MVVPVLIISCQVFEKLNAGPVVAQIMMTRTAIVKAHALPRMVEELRAKTRNASRTTQKKSRSRSFFLSFSAALVTGLLLTFAPEFPIARTKRAGRFLPSAWQD